MRFLVLLPTRWFCVSWGDCPLEDVVVDGVGVILSSGNKWPSIGNTPPGKVLKLYGEVGHIRWRLAPDCTNGGWVSKKIRAWMPTATPERRVITRYFSTVSRSAASSGQLRGLDSSKFPNPRFNSSKPQLARIVLLSSFCLGRWTTPHTTDPSTKNPRSTRRPPSPQEPQTSFNQAKYPAILLPFFFLPLPLLACSTHSGFRWASEATQYSTHVRTAHTKSLETAIQGC